MADTPIRIMAEPSDAYTCVFTVDRPLLEGRAVRFPGKDRAAGSPLAEAIFAVPGVRSVSVSGGRVTVKKDNADEWMPLAKQIGAAIREKLASGVPPISDAALKPGPNDEEIRRKIERLMETDINPAVAGHGGHIELVGVQGGAVYIHMSGGCQGCGMASVTLKQGVERLIRENVPEIEEILDVTDHSAGSSPYYAPAK